MGHTAVVQTIGYFGEGMVPTGDKLLGIINLPEDHKIFNGTVGGLGKEVGQMGIGILQLIGQIGRDFVESEIIIAQHPVYGVLDALNQDHLGVSQDLDSIVMEPVSQSLELLRGQLPVDFHLPQPIEGMGYAQAVQLLL